MATRLRAPFRVQTSGMNSPVASANPATTPVASWVWLLRLANAVPLVPSETPRTRPTPQARAGGHVVAGPGAGLHPLGRVTDDLRRAPPPAAARARPKASSTRSSR